MKLPKWFKRNKPEEDIEFKETYTRAEVERFVRTAHDVGYNDGKRDGLNIARQSAEKALKEALWQQNQNHLKQKEPTQN